MPPGGITDLLKEREKLEESINQQFGEVTTVLFTDIAGYTRFVETYGDLEARAMLQKHNDILFPIIREHGGTVIKTIGDAVMASFDDPQDAVRSAIAIQKRLKDYNLHVEKSKRIHIRIGMNMGKVLRDGDDLFGDAVNVAARIEPKAKPGQIFVSKSLYEVVKNNEDIIFHYQGTEPAKGKTEPLELYRVSLQGDVDDSDGTEGIEDGMVPGTRKVKPLNKGVLFIVGSILMFLVAVALFIYPGILIKKKAPVLTPYLLAYQQYKNGQLDASKQNFEKLGENDPRYYEGLAALSYKRGSLQKARKLSDQALNLDPQILYPHVIKGNIFFDQNKLDMAGPLYSRAIRLSTPVTWQKAEAFYRMGRISSASQKAEDALKFYNQAISLDRVNPDILTAKGLILEKMGRMNEALGCYQVARGASADNQMIVSFLHRAEKKVNAEADKEKQARFDRIVSDLLKKMKNGKIVPGRDRWTSRPLSLFFVTMQRKGEIPLLEGEDEFFLMCLIQELEKSGAIEMVERELLDKLLTELKMSSSNLSDPSTALELGRILSARLIGSPTFLRYGRETQVNIKLIETETSAIKANASESFGRDQSVLHAVDKVSRKILDKLASAFPIRGKITGLAGDSITLNIGSRVGVKKGLIMRVFEKPKEKNNLKGREIGKLMITSVEQNKSQARVLKSAIPLSTGSLAEAILTANDKLEIISS